MAENDLKQEESDKDYESYVDETILDKIKNIFTKKNTPALAASNEKSHHKTTSMGFGGFEFMTNIRGNMIEFASSVSDKVRNTITKLTSKSSNEILNRPGAIQTNAKPIMSQIIQPEEIVQAQIKSKSNLEQNNTINNPENNNIVTLAGTVHKQESKNLQSNDMESADINVNDNLQEYLENTEVKELTEEEINQNAKRDETPITNQILSVSNMTVAKSNEKTDKTEKETETDGR